MEFKGTQGKWEQSIEYCKKFKQPIININSEYKKEFVVIYSGLDKHDEIDDTTKADALLISKAPELLEMLQFIYEKYETDGHLLNVSPSMIKNLINQTTEL